MKSEKFEQFINEEKRTENLITTCKITNIEYIKKAYNLLEYTLTDFIISSNNVIYFLFNKFEKEDYMNTMIIEIYYNQKENIIVSSQVYDFGKINLIKYDLQSKYTNNYAYPKKIRILKDDFLLISSEIISYCFGLHLNKKGELIKKIDLHDGIQECITNTETEIVVIYDEDYGLYSTDEISQCGFAIFDCEGNIIWKNQIYNNVEYSNTINVDKDNNVWWLYYKGNDEFNLIFTNKVCTKIIIIPSKYLNDLRYTSNLVVSLEQKKIMFIGNNNKSKENNFYLFNLENDELKKIKKFKFSYNGENINVTDNKHIRSYGSKVLLIDKENNLYYYDLDME